MKRLPFPPDCPCHHPLSLAAPDHSHILSVHQACLEHSTGEYCASGGQGVWFVEEPRHHLVSLSRVFENWPNAIIIRHQKQPQVGAHLLM